MSSEPAAKTVCEESGTEDDNASTADAAPCNPEAVESGAFDRDDQNKDEERRTIESTMIEMLIQRGPEKTC